MKPDYQQDHQQDAIEAGPHSPCFNTDTGPSIERDTNITIDINIEITIDITIDITDLTLFEPSF